MFNDSDSDSLQMGKKRKRKPENYKRNQIKMARLTGLAYDSHCGKKVNAKVVGNPCR